MKSLLNIIGGLVIAAGFFYLIFFSGIIKNDPNQQCINLAKQVVDLTKKEADNQFITVDQIKTEEKLKPNSLEIPGMIIKSCTGQAFTKSGRKVSIAFFESRKDGSIVNAEHFVGYEER